MFEKALKTMNRWGKYKSKQNQRILKLNCFIFLLLGHSEFTKQSWQASPCVKIVILKQQPFRTLSITMNDSSETNNAFTTINSLSNKLKLNETIRSYWRSSLRFRLARNNLLGWTQYRVVVCSRKVTRLLKSNLEQRACILISVRQS